MKKAGGIREQMVHGHMMNGANWNIWDEKSGTILTRMAMWLLAG